MKSELQTNTKYRRDLKMLQITEESRLFKEQKKVKFNFNLKQNEEIMNIIKIEEMLNNKNKNDYIKSQHKSFSEKKKSQEVQIQIYNQMERKNRLRMELEEMLIGEERLRQDAEVI